VVVAHIYVPVDKLTVFYKDEVAELGAATEVITNRVQSVAYLVQIYQPHQQMLQQLIDAGTPLINLIPIMTNTLGGWYRFLLERDYDQQDSSNGLSLSVLCANFASLTMRSLALFLLNQPNIMERQRHYFLQRNYPGKVGKTTVNLSFRHLSLCMVSANQQFVALRNSLQGNPLSHYAIWQQFGPLCAVIQDGAMLELALARYKTLPGTKTKFEGMSCGCSRTGCVDTEQCGKWSTTSSDHLARARRRAWLVRKYKDRIVRDGVGAGYVDRWLAAFDDVADMIEKALTERTSENKAVLVEPVRRFEDLEFVFQYSPFGNDS